MKTATPWMLAGLCLAVLPAHAQDGMNQTADLLRALKLPTATQAARELGIPDQDIQSVLAMARDRKVPVGALTETFEEQVKAVREYGPVDNFGAFVQKQLDSGLRGKELAAAIKAEHKAHGKGKDYLKSMGAKGAAHAADQAEGKADEMGRNKAEAAKSMDKANETAKDMKDKTHGKSDH